MSAPHSIGRALQLLREKVTAAASGRAVTLVAVSKTKPPSAIMEAYQEQHRHFGENYVAELVEKAQQLPGDIRWHFIGHLQSNKGKVLAKIPNLYMVESVDNEKAAKELNKACKDRADRLKVLIQVNTSGETSKSGCQPSEAASLFGFVLHNCEKLQASGLMTIGRLAETPQPDCFDSLRDCRHAVAQQFASDGVKEEELELSMGMSGDWQLAVEHGSTMIRLGSSIFGDRDYGKNKHEDENAREVDDEDEHKKSAAASSS